MSSRKQPMTPSAASRIQSTQAKSGNPTGKDSFPARVQSAAAKNVNSGVVNTGGAKTASNSNAKPSGGGSKGK